MKTKKGCSQEELERAQNSLLRTIGNKILTCLETGNVQELRKMAFLLRKGLK